MQDIYKIGVDGEKYCYADNNTKFGWRSGTEYGAYNGHSTQDYFITNGEIVVRCVDIMTWETDDGEDGCVIEGLLEEWIEEVNNGEEGYTIIYG